MNTPMVEMSVTEVSVTSTTEVTSDNGQSWESFPEPQGWSMQWDGSNLNEAPSDQAAAEGH